MTWPTSAQTPQLEMYALPSLIAKPVGIVSNVCARDDRPRAVLADPDQCTSRVTRQQAVLRDLQHVERVVRTEGEMSMMLVNPLANT